LTRSVVIDGNHTAHRLWHKLALSTKTGKPSGIVHGVLSSLCTIIGNLSPTYTYIVWDRKSRYRQRLLTNYRTKLERAARGNLNATSADILIETPRLYKESRYKTRTNGDHSEFQDVFLPQVQDLQYIMPHVGIRSLCVPEVEGDDLIGLATDILAGHGEVVIVSTDQDLYQLLSDKVKMYDPIKKTFFTRDDFWNKYGITPDRWPEVKALMGDDSDDIPGVPKIGEVRALELIRKYNIQDLIEACKQAPKKSYMTTIPEYEDQIKLAYDMSFILSSPDNLDDDQQSEFRTQWEAPAKVDWDEIRAFCTSYELNKVYSELRKLLITRADEEAVAKCTTLDELFAYWGENCGRCALAANRICLVKYGGSPKARIALCGEGPGAAENLLGEPFIGKAGRWMEEFCLRPNGLARPDLHILNTVMCRPVDENGDNRAPTPDEMAACHPRLAAQIKLSEAKVVVMIGDKALKSFFPESGKISQERGADTPMEHPDYPGIKFVAVFHPSFLMRQRPNHSTVIKSRTDWKYIARLANE